MLMFSKSSFTVLRSLFLDKSFNTLCPELIATWIMLVYGISIQSLSVLQLKYNENGEFYCI
jgi:hypothetical protein